MTQWWTRAFCATMTLASTPAAADPTPAHPRRAEVAAGVFAHTSRIAPLGSPIFRPAPQPGFFYEGEEERGTVDVQAVYRARPIRWALQARPTAKLQLNTGGRTSFASIGAEWRQHAFGGRVYVQGGIGVTVHDGYRFTPDPFEPGLLAEEFARRYNLYRRHTSFGSRVLFNPNASIGMRLSPRYSVELAWEHFSHRQIFNEQNPGIDNFGLRLVRKLGR